MHHWFVVIDLFLLLILSSQYFLYSIPLESYCAFANIVILTFPFFFKLIVSLVNSQIQLLLILDYEIKIIDSACLPNQCRNC
jgi:hypothetical protein